MELTDGEIVLFSTFMDYGTATLNLGAVGRWSVDADMPDAAAAVCVLDGWQEETMSTVLLHCVVLLRGAGALPGDYTVQYFTWGDDQPYRFDVTTRRFERAGTA